MIYRILRRLLFRLDAEEAHELATANMIRMQRMPLVLRLIRRINRIPAGAARELWGLKFATPIGLGGGFDKNATMIPFLAALGFGFIEVGTVTPHPQDGNPRPRLFRYPGHEALVNRLGFNNDGADTVARRLRAWNDVKPREGRPPVFANVGKNRDVPLEEAAGAYSRCYEVVGPWADGAVVNLSSPNTPGLRDLQKPAHLREILLALRKARAGLPFARGGAHPILVKIAPDLDATQVRAICEVCAELADGIVATNTTIDRSSVPEAAGEAGGLSGKPLFAASTSVLRSVREIVGRDYPLVGVGGIFSVDDVRRKLEAGANLVEVYTGFIYEGPGLAARLARELSS